MKRLITTFCLAIMLLHATAQEERKTIALGELQDVLSKAVDTDLPFFLKSSTGYYTASNNTVYDVWDSPSSDPDITSGTMMQRYHDVLRMISEIHPTLVSTIGMWGLPYSATTPQWSWHRFKQRGKAVVTDIKHIDNNIVVMGSPNEYVDQHMLDGVGTIPAWVFQDFGLSVVSRPFDLTAMTTFPKYNVPMGTNAWAPNIRTLEAQMWFYFLGRTYMELGCEALSFCQVQLMNGQSKGDGFVDNYTDWDNPQYWNVVFDKLRSFANTRPDLRYVLITGHTKGMKDDAGKLAFDFHSSPIRPIEDPNYNMPAPNSGGGCIVDNAGCGDIFEESMGGITPSGWKTAHNPAMTWIDNWGYNDHAWKNNLIGTPVGANGCWGPYYYDEISWFASTPWAYRNEWLQYGYYKVKCLDKKVSMSMPLTKNLNPTGNVWAVYNANNPSSFFPTPPTLTSSATDWNAFPPPPGNALYGYAQENTIKDVFSNLNNSPVDWTYHNFSKEDVLANAIPHNIRNGLTFVGNDKIYYVADDGTIHGYIWENNAWLTVSPTFACSTPFASQVKCAGSLVASPDGSTLLYVGTDGYIHGFTINNWWSYSYLDFMMSDMISQSIVAEPAHNGLIFPTNDRIYYMARESNHQRRMHAFWKDANGVWHTASPSHSANVFNNQPLSSQAQLSKGLAYDPVTKRIFYIGTDLRIYYYEEIANTGWNYTFHDGTTGPMVAQGVLAASQNLAIHGNKIFYGSQDKRIHALIDLGSQWGSVSPSHSANIFNGQPLNTQEEVANLGYIAVSPNGSIIAYNGQDGKPHYYKDLGVSNFSYNKVKGVPASVDCGASLKFTDNWTFYYNNSTGLDRDVHYHKLEKCNCQNAAITVIENGYQYKNSNNGQNNSDDGENITAIDPQQITEPRQIDLYPNPADNYLYFRGATENLSFHITNIVGSAILSGAVNDRIDVSSLNKGIYIITIVDGSKQAIKKQKLLIE